MPDANQILQGKIASIAVAGVFTYIGYKAFEGLYNPKSKTKRRSSTRRLKRKSSKRISSRFIRDTGPLPMRRFATHTSRKRMLIKAEDWVNEQNRLRSLRKSSKKRG